MAGLGTACGSLDGLPHSAFCSRPPPTFHRRCQGLCSLTQISCSMLTHLFIISSLKCWAGVGGGRVDQRHLGQDRGSKSYRGNSCMMRGQVIGVCGGRVGDSGTSCSRKVPVHQGEAFKVPHRALPRCPCGTRRSAFVGSLAPGPCFCVCFFLCILKSGTMTFPGPGVSCLIRYIVPIN